MVRALASGDGKCLSMHGADSLLLTVPRPGVRALDREADPVEGGRLAGDSVAAPLGRRRAPGAWEMKAGRMPDWAPRYRPAPRDPHVPGGAIRHIAMKLFGRFANNLDRPQEIGGDDRKRASICSVAPRLAIYLLM
jgi:hypothetical protein